MKRATALVALVASVILSPTAGAGSACRHLLVDPAGDATFYDSGDPSRPVDDGRLLDLLSADLVSDRSALTIVMRVTPANPEGGTDYLDHEWQLSFSTASARFRAYAVRSRTGGVDQFGIARVDGDGSANEEPVSGAQGIADPVTGSVDVRKGIIRIRVPLSAFDAAGGLGRRLDQVRTLTGSGVAAYLPGTGGNAVFFGSDLGRSSSAYVPGAKACGT